MELSLRILNGEHKQSRSGKNDVKLKENNMNLWKKELTGDGWNCWDIYTCPVCGEKFWEIRNKDKYHFCPNCGERLDGKQ